jgi:hypothetical protein
MWDNRMSVTDTVKVTGFVIACNEDEEDVGDASSG